ncbi:Type 4 prepilin-like proteins leader peptide-processing enzyme [Pandoraea terrae]|uniref:Prepilin leader peptidase/N-methyltransferase n=2 Tax=Pandoraea terrae TaxID=1537710 RepID=A0A5E4T761_9BURK|nr:Type 4 prepilin-like proteins leader peptide-processing enzyme [Pandoraea terrae]
MLVLAVWLGWLAVDAAERTRVVAACAIIGLCTGSFLNVVVYRLPRMLEAAWAREAAEISGAPAVPAERFNLAWPPSRCPSCETRIAAWQNVPVLSYVWLRGRCGACDLPIGTRYPLVETLTSLVFGVIGWHFGAFGHWPALVAYAAFCAMLLALALIDADTCLLPDALTLPLVWLGLLASVAGITVTPDDSVIGAAGGYLGLWLVASAYRAALGRDGLGAGDCKLVAALGAWLGWPMLPVVLVLGSLLSCVVGGLTLARRGESMRTPLPFGPSLVAAGFVALAWGDRIVGTFVDMAAGF